MSTATRAIAAIVALLGVSSCAARVDSSLMAAHEVDAIRQMKSVQQAETQYYAQFGKYGAALPELKDLITPELATGKSNGYLFTLSARPNGFAVAAIPETFNTTGSRSFYSDESLTIHQSKSATEPATAASPELQ